MKSVHVSPVQTHFLLIAYGPATAKSKAASNVRSSFEYILICSATWVIVADQC